MRFVDNISHQMLFIYLFLIQEPSYVLPIFLPSASDIAKVAQWLGASDLWAVLWVLIIGIAWEIFEYFVEGTEETYGSVERWAWNTASDIVVEVGAAWWMVLPAGSLIG